MRPNWGYINYHDRKQKITGQKLKIIGSKLKVKTMKKSGTLAIIILLFLIYAGAALGQEYKVDLGSGKVKIHEVNEVNIEGHDENFVLISRRERRSGDSERAKGLKVINSLGLEDNTGIGLSAVKSGDEVELRPISRHSDTRYTIFIPKSVSVFYEHSSHHGDDLKIKNVQSELDITVKFNSIYLEDVSGPMTINTVHGDVDGVFSQVSQESAISIVSAHGHIDLALPSDTKAKLRLRTNYGEIYTDMNIDYDTTSNLSRISSSEVNGSLNGGGVDINLSSDHNNIYLRSKK